MTSLPPIDRLLPLLDKVRRVGKGHWQARCPAHEDKSPSLSVTTNTNGDILLHCHAGCRFADILGSVGLRESDAFTDKERSTDERPPVPPSCRGLSRHEFLEAFRHESFVVFYGECDRRRGLLTPSDAERVDQAQARVSSWAAFVRDGDIDPRIMPAALERFLPPSTPLVEVEV